MATFVVSRLDPGARWLRPSPPPRPCWATCFRCGSGFRGGKGVATGARRLPAARAPGRASSAWSSSASTLVVCALRVGQLDRRGRQPAPPGGSLRRASGGRGSPRPRLRRRHRLEAPRRTWSGLVAGTERRVGSKAVKVAVVGGRLVGHGPRRPPRRGPGTTSRCSCATRAAPREHREPGGELRATCPASILPDELRIDCPASRRRASAAMVVVAIPSESCRGVCRGLRRALRARARRSSPPPRGSSSTRCGA